MRWRGFAVTLTIGILTSVFAAVTVTRLLVSLWLKSKGKVIGDLYLTEKIDPFNPLDESGLKFDEDRSFGSVDLRRAFNQVRILDKYGYGSKGEFVGLDVKAVRTQKQDVATKHLSNSRTIFLRLVEVVRGLDTKKVDKLVAGRDYEELDMLILNALMGA